MLVSIPVIIKMHVDGVGRLLLVYAEIIVTFFKIASINDANSNNNDNNSSNNNNILDINIFF